MCGCIVKRVLIIMVKGDHIMVKGDHIVVKGDHIVVKGYHIVVKGYLIVVKGYHNGKGSFCGKGWSCHINLSPIIIIKVEVLRSNIYGKG